jgi:hypothetical protein
MPEETRASFARESFVVPVPRKTTARTMLMIQRTTDMTAPVGWWPDGHGAVLEVVTWCCLGY